MSTKLNQVIAIEKGVKNRVHDEVSTLHKALQKADLFNGFAKQFKPLSAEGEQFPDENKKVQFNAADVLEQIGKSMTELIDIQSSKDATNQLAKADVVVDGTVLLTSVPATTLINLEKQLTDFRSDIEAAPVLEQAENWDKDVNSNLFRTPLQRTHRTKKVQKPIVLFPATDKHPAQTQLITEDETVGHWELVKMSGALPAPERERLLRRVNKLVDAVKAAREAANMQEAVELKVGSLIFNYLLS